MMELDQSSNYLLILMCPSAIVLFKLMKMIQIYFYTDNSGTLTEALRIDNNQNVSIGNDNPDVLLDVGDSSMGQFLAMEM